MSTTPNTNTKSKPAKSAKSTKKTPAASAGARSELQGGHVPASRYAKDPKNVIARLKEKLDLALQQAANTTVRAEKNGIEDKSTKKLRAAMDHIEAAKKALA